MSSRTRRPTEQIKAGQRVLSEQEQPVNQKLVDVAAKQNRVAADMEQAPDSAEREEMEEGCQREPARPPEKAGLFDEST